MKYEILKNPKKPRIRLFHPKLHLLILTYLILFNILILMPEDLLKVTQTEKISQILSHNNKPSTIITVARNFETGKNPES